MQSLKCQCGKTELSQGARCPFCKTVRLSEGESRLLIDLAGVGRDAEKATQRANASTANIDRILKGLAPSLPPVVR